MTGAALIAMIVALASPVAHGPVGVSCAPTVNLDGRLGQAAPWQPQVQVELTNDICRRFARVVLHRSGTSGYNQYGLHVVLHEAAHVAQWREGVTRFDPLDTSRWWEHDAECRTLRATGPALASLGYKPAAIRAELKAKRLGIRSEAAPYGGAC